MNVLTEAKIVALVSELKQEDGLVCEGGCAYCRAIYEHVRAACERCECSCLLCVNQGRRDSDESKI